MGKLDGKVAIVTGGGSGCGEGLAIAYVKEGAAVVITGRRANVLEEAKAGMMKIPGAKVLAIAADGSDEEVVKDVVRQTVEAFGRIDILAQSAQQISIDLPVEQTTAEDLRINLETGLYATLFYMKHCFPYLKESKGVVINFGSESAQGAVGHAAYGANKGAISSLTRTAANEWGKYGINVNLINPAVLTKNAEAWMRGEPPYRQANMDVYNRMIAETPLGRFGEPERDVGGLGVFLATPEGRYMTGMTFLLNGGHTMRA